MSKVYIILLLSSFVCSLSFAESKGKEKSSWSKFTESPVEFGKEVVGNTKKSIEKSVDTLDKKVKDSRKEKASDKKESSEEKNQKKKTKSL